MGSRRRPYLDLKSSIVNLFRTPQRWLKDILQKESLFEKPYQDLDYRHMQYKFRPPGWDQLPKRDGGFWPARRGTWTFKFDPGICTLGVVTIECGATAHLGVSIGLLPPGDVETIAWSAKSSNPNVVRIAEIENGISGTIVLESLGEDGQATICVTGRMVGYTISELVVPWEAGGVLDYRNAASIPSLSRTYINNKIWDCGCVDISVECCDDSTIAYDNATSPATISRGGGAGCAAPASATVYITDDANGAPYTWSVSGTGFWLDSGCTITSLQTSSKSVTLYTDATACGPGVISITGCGGNTVYGYIRCVVGAWHTKQTNGIFPTGWVSAGTCAASGCCTGASILWSSSGVSGGRIVNFNRVNRGYEVGGTLDCYYGGSGGGDCQLLSSINYTFTDTGINYDWADFIIAYSGTGGLAYGCSNRSHQFQAWECP